MVDNFSQALHRNHPEISNHEKSARVSLKMIEDDAAAPTNC